MGFCHRRATSLITQGSPAHGRPATEFSSGFSDRTSPPSLARSEAAAGAGLPGRLLLCQVKFGISVFVPLINTGRSAA